LTKSPEAYRACKGRRPANTRLHRQEAVSGQVLFGQAAPMGITQNPTETLDAAWFHDVEGLVTVSEVT
jgi:hypothetical protein